MTPLIFFIYLLIGTLAGFSAGLLGIGGGLVTVPALILVFTLLDFPEAYLMQMAIGTSLAAMVFTAASSAWAHHLKKGVYWHLFVLLLPGIIIGSILGALAANHLSSKELKLVFGVFECLIGLYFLLGLEEKVQKSQGDPVRPFTFIIIGFLIGFVSTLLGIGGGILTVPILIRLCIPLRNAISTSAATGFIIALIGAISFLVLGFNQHTPIGTFGYVYLPAFIFIAVTSTLMAPIGAKYTYSLPVKQLRHVFGGVLIAVGIWIILQNFF